MRSHTDIWEELASRTSEEQIVSTPRQSPWFTTS